MTNKKYNQSSSQLFAPLVFEMEDCVEIFFYQNFLTAVLAIKMAKYEKREGPGEGVEDGREAGENPCFDKWWYNFPFSYNWLSF